MTKKKPSKQLSPDREIVRIRFPDWVFFPLPPEDGETFVRVRLLGSKERDALEAFLLPLDFSGFCRRLISLSMVDRDGNRALQVEDEDVLDQYPTLLFALADAILKANGMMPPPDQNVGPGEYASIKSVKETLREDFPSLSDGIMKLGWEIASRLSKPVFSFQRSYKIKYRPGSKVRDLLLPHLPEAGDERIAAAERFIGNRLPMHKGRIAEHRAEIWDAFGVTSYAEEKELIKQLGIESLFPVVARLREKLGIWTPDEEMLEKAWSELREETTHNALPYEGVEDEDGNPTWRKRKTSPHPMKLIPGVPKGQIAADPEDRRRHKRQIAADPEDRRRHEEAIAYKLKVSGIKVIPPPRGDDLHDEGHLEYFVNPFDGLDTALAEEEAAIAAKEERERLIQKLTPRRRKYLTACLTAKGDMERAAKKLGIKRKSLEQYLRRMTDEQAIHRKIKGK